MKAMRRFLLLVSLALSVIAQSSPLTGQAPASERQLIAVKVTGSKRFSEQAIVAASGLRIGTAVTDDDFKSAARRLGDTGVFTNIEYTYSYSSAGTKLEFHVSDADKFVAVRFEDFVWFTDAELMSRIKDSVPLFDGMLPLSGRMPDQVSDVLQAMLVEKGLPGHVEFLRSGASNGPIDAIVYQVSDVAIQIRNIEFTGAGEAELGELKAASKRVFDREYSRAVLSALVQHQLLPVYQARGYLKAAFGPPEPKVVKPPSTQGDETVRNLTTVDVYFAVTPGKQYKLKAVSWSGNHEFPTDTLQKMVRAQAGEPVNSVRIADNLKDVQKLYGSRGYVTATLKADADFDDAAATAIIQINVKEGPVFHMGDLEFRGLDNSLTDKLRNAWKIRPGDVYDSTYLSEYLPAAHKLLPTTLDWDVSSHVTANMHDKSVDVDIIYAAKAPK